MHMNVWCWNKHALGGSKVYYHMLLGVGHGWGWTVEVYFYLEGKLSQLPQLTGCIVRSTEILCNLVCVFPFQTHSGSVWRVTWAHPEYGQVLATCSFDRTVGVWEEQSMYIHSHADMHIYCRCTHYLHLQLETRKEQKFTGYVTETCAQVHTSILYAWTLCYDDIQVKRTSLVDSRTAVNDVKFAPRHLGLQLVSVYMTKTLYWLCGVTVCSGIMFYWWASENIRSSWCDESQPVDTQCMYCYFLHHASVLFHDLFFHAIVQSAFFQHDLSCKPGTSCLSWNPSR